MSQRAVGVGLVGLGTVGTGVVKLLQRNAQVIAQRLGFPLELRRIANRELETGHGLELDGLHFDTDVEGLLADPTLDIVIELIGGSDAARKLIHTAIGNGKHVVTANKALLAEHGAELFDAAAARGVDVAFEASVGGGIPILRALREGLAANRIESLHGIMNGTTNYVLSEMEKTGDDFEAVLARAQELGLAEADPHFDVDGVDAAHKLTLLVAMALGAQISCDAIPTEGIRELSPVDFEVAREFGLRIKLLGIARPRPLDGGGRRIEARVHPTLIPAGSLLAHVDGAMNAIAIHGDAAGPTLFYGAGAGAFPTASAVVADLMEIARAIRRGFAGRVAPLSYLPDHLEPCSIVPLAELEGRCYLIFGVADRPGVLAQLTALLAEHGVSIEAVLQRGGSSADSVRVHLLTHRTREASVQAATAAIARKTFVTQPPRMIRVEEGF